MKTAKVIDTCVPLATLLIYLRRSEECILVQLSEPIEAAGCLHDPNFAIYLSERRGMFGFAYNTTGTLQEVLAELGYTLISDAPTTTPSLLPSLSPRWAEIFS